MAIFSCANWASASCKRVTCASLADARARASPCACPNASAARARSRQRTRRAGCERDEYEGGQGEQADREWLQEDCRCNQDEQ